MARFAVALMTAGLHALPWCPLTCLLGPLLEMAYASVPFVMVRSLALDLTGSPYSDITFLVTSQRTVTSRPHALPA